MEQTGILMDMQNVHSVIRVRGCIMVVPTTVCTKTSSITYTCSLCREIRSRTVFPLLHIHIHSISIRKFIIIIDTTHRSGIEPRICKLEPQFTRGNPPACRTRVENRFFRSVVIVYMYIISLVNRISLHSLGSRLQSTPKFVIAFSYWTPVSIIEIIALLLYVTFISVNIVRSSDKNRGIGDGVSDSSGQGTPNYRMEQLVFICARCLMYFNLVGVVIMQICMFVIIIMMFAYYLTFTGMYNMELDLTCIV